MSWLGSLTHVQIPRLPFSWFVCVRVRVCLRVPVFVSLLVAAASRQQLRTCPAVPRSNDIVPVSLLRASHAAQVRETMNDCSFPA